MGKKRHSSRRKISSNRHPSARTVNDKNESLPSAEANDIDGEKSPEDTSKGFNIRSLPKRTIVGLGAMAAIFFTAISGGLGTGIASKIFSFSGHSGAQLSVNIQPDPALLMFQPWIFPPHFPVSRLSSDYQDINIWAPPLGGTPAGVMVLKVSVTALQEGGITITGIEASIVRRSLLGPHILVDNPGQGGGLVPNTTVGLNLDREQPSASVFSDPVASYTAKFLGGAYFSSYSIDLPESATHVFEVVAYAQQADIQWDLQIDYVAGGKAGHIIETDNGRPFQLAGLSGHTRFAAAYLPGYLATPPNSKQTWTNVGKTLCPNNYSPC